MERYPKENQLSNTEEILITHDKELIILVCKELLQNSKDKEKQEFPEKKNVNT